MTTTAARSRDYLRTKGYVDAVVEHRSGKFRFDLFGIGDTIALPVPLHPKGILLVQAYLNTKRNREKHAMFDLSHPMVLRWRAVGGRFEHHRWKKVKGRWTGEVLEI